jgi:hypothetical protein
LPAEDCANSPNPHGTNAWIPRGAGSTITRRIRIDGIYQRWVPIPDARGDLAVLDFVSEVEKVVTGALEDFQEKVEAKSNGAPQASHSAKPLGLKERLAQIAARGDPHGSTL